MTPIVHPFTSLIVFPLRLLPSLCVPSQSSLLVVAAECDMQVFEPGHVVCIDRKAKKIVVSVRWG